jgi:uroporphyrinogen-III decarboxylase
MKSQIDKLVDKVLKLDKSQRNQNLRKFWQDFYAFKERDKVPISVNFVNAFWVKTLNFNLVEMYEKPERYLMNTLKARIFHHDQFLDDSILEQEVNINFGTALVPSLFGIEPIFRQDTDPWRGKPIIKCDKDLESIDYPDFHKSGLMPRIHRFYEDLNRIACGRFKVTICPFDRGPWGVAWYLRGLKELIVDTYTNPDFVHRIMKFVTESRLRWEREREIFLSEKMTCINLFNDEVNCEIISPRIYEKFIYPYERKIAESYPKGIFYYHSCGNLTPILEKIAILPGLKRLQISPSTDFKVAANKLDGRIVFHRRLHTVNDVLLANSQKMKTILRENLDIGSQCVMELDAAPISSGSTEKIKEWIQLAREIIKDYGKSME